MPKILMYSVRDDEQPAIQKWSKDHHVTVDTTNREFQCVTCNAKCHDYTPHWFLY